MTTTGRVFRVFISSTFMDKKEERNALQERVFPRLRELAAAHGCRFQAIDLRWGVSEEAGLDQATMGICLNEIKRSQKISPRPNFIVLLGDRYGWCPLPTQIGADEFEIMLEKIPKEDRELILWDGEKPAKTSGWYRKDENAVPPEYRLRERKVETTADANAEERQSALDLEAEGWSEIEQRIRTAFLSAIERLEWVAEDFRREKYEASATEQEILQGALDLPEGVPEAKEHVFCFFRSIQDLPEDETALDYVDIIEGIGQDAQASAKLDRLKERLIEIFPETRVEELIAALRALATAFDDRKPGEEMRRRLRKLLAEDLEVPKLKDRLRQVLVETAPEDLDPEVVSELQRLLPNVYHYQTRWQGTAPGKDHLARLCEEVYESLAGVINAEIAKLGADELESEIENHVRFGEDRTGKSGSRFIGRQDILDRISKSIDDPNGFPLAVFGASGTGKSALMARAAQLAAERPYAEIALRFIGATPESADGRALLLSLCQQIARCYGGSEVYIAQGGGSGGNAAPKEEAALPSDYRELVEEFQRQLSRATAEKPLIVFIDALDQLSDSDGARKLLWLPRELPEHVSLVVSTATDPRECLDALEAKLPGMSLIELERMTRENGEDLLKLWLNDVDRTLQPGQFNYVLDQFTGISGDESAGGLPLYLKLAFEEVRLWRSYSNPADTVLETSISGVIRDNLLGRLSDGGNHGRLMVSHSLGYLAAAKNGLSEGEMLDLLSLDKEIMADFQRRSPKSPRVKSLPIIVWSRLFGDLAPYLSERSGDGTSLMTFYHRQLGEVVREDYLAGDEGRIRHAHLAKHFLEQDLEITHTHGTTPNLRKMSELPFQLTHAYDEEGLRATLTQFEFLRAKTMASGSQPLIEDYEEAERNDIQLPSLRAIKGALQLSAHVLDDDPSQIGSQLTGRLLQNDLEPVRELLKGSRKGNRPWLRPLKLSLMQPGGSLLRTLVGHRSPISGVAFTEEGQFIASKSRDGTVRVWDFDSGDAVRAIANRENADQEWQRVVRTGILVEDPAHRRSVRIAYDTIEVHEGTSSDQPVLLLGHNRKVTTHAFSPDGMKLVTGGDDHTVRVWELGTDSAEIRVDHAGGVTAVAAAQNGRWAISGCVDGTLRLWDLKTGVESKELSGHSGRVNAIALTPDGRRAVTASSDSTLRVWDLDSGVELHVFIGHDAPVLALAMTPDGRRAVSASKDKKLIVWDLMQGRQLSRVRGPQSMDPAIAISPDGRLAVAAYRDRVLRVWDLDNSKRITTCIGHQNTINAVAFSPDGNHIVSGSDDQTLRVWEATTGRMRAKLLGHWDYVRNLVFTTNDRVVSISEDDTLRIWDFRSGKEIHRLGGRKIDPSHLSRSPSTPRTGVSPNAPASIVTVPDGRWTASFYVNDDTLRLWDIEKGERIAAFTGDGVLACCAISERADIIAGTLNGQVHLLRLEGMSEGSA